MDNECILSVSKYYHISSGWKGYFVRFGPRGKVVTTTDRDKAKKYKSRKRAENYALEYSMRFREPELHKTGILTYTGYTFKAIEY